jgi:hypothetical protein
MKNIKKLVVHPELGNDIRQEVVAWCTQQWGDYREEDSVWWTTSNYTRSYNGTFDMIFNDVKSAEFFILRWGGQIVDIEYEENFAPDPVVLNTLFE